MSDPPLLQSPPEESTHLKTGQVLKSYSGKKNSRGLPYFLWSWSNVGQTPFGKIKKCRHLKEFWNEAWPTFGQLHRGYDAPPGIDLGPLDFEYPALFQVCTFFLVEIVQEAHENWQMPLNLCQGSCWTGFIVFRWCDKQKRWTLFTLRQSSLTILKNKFWPYPEIFLT